MSQLLKVQLEDEDGNIYYLHTSGDSVFLDDGRTVQAAIEQTVRQSAISNVQVNDTSKVPSAALAYAMQQQITKNEDAISVLNSDLIGRAIYATDLFTDQETPIFVVWDAYTQNTPYKQGLTDSTFGFGLAGGHPDTFFTIFTCTIAKNELYMYSVSNGAPTGWEKIYPK